MGSRKYPLLNDKDWLYHQYVVKGIGTRKIASLIGVKTCNSVRQALIRFGIPIRSIRESLIYRRDEDYFILNDSVITGCLLGDGFLRSYSRTDQSAPFFCKRNKNKDHLLYVSSLLFSKDSDSRVSEESYFSKAIGREYTSYFLRSLSHDCLKTLMDEWYPEASGYRKVVPNSVEINEVVLLHWFLDDGNSYQRADRETRQVIVTFCSEGFLKEHQEMLCSKVNSRFDLGMHLRRYHQGTGWRLGVPQSKTGLFFEIIGSPPVESLVYKWK